MQQAGWTLADPITVRSAWGIVVSSVTRRSYPTAPVSPLVLFGRVQAFAYQQEVDGNPAQRHHVRFWPTPSGWLLPGGHRVGWLAAGTYDRSVGLSLFTWQVTHKIDADIDLERDYIIESVQYAEPKVTVTVLENFSTGYHSRNGGGDAVHTDGNLPILDVRALRPTGPEPQPNRRTDDPTDLTSRPPAIAAGVLLVLAAVVCEAFSYVPELSQVLMSSELGTQENRVLVLAVITVMGLLYLGYALLLWRIMVGRSWARLLLLGLLCWQVITQLTQWINLPAGRLSWLALLTTGLYVLAVYALSSLTARNWTSRPR